jgi:hypothetical protein
MAIYAIFYQFCGRMLLFGAEKFLLKVDEEGKASE